MAEIYFWFSLVFPPETLSKFKILFPAHFYLPKQRTVVIFTYITGIVPLWTEKMSEHCEKKIRVLHWPFNFFIADFFLSIFLIGVVPIFFIGGWIVLIGGWKLRIVIKVSNISNAFHFKKNMFHICCFHFPLWWHDPGTHLSCRCTKRRYNNSLKCTKNTFSHSPESMAKLLQHVFIIWKG
jgi:hypothetical protein